MELKGIDLSYSNGKVDWNKIKAHGIDFAIIRMGYGIDNPNQVDKQFDVNYQGAKSVGIPIGAYHYSYAYSVEEAEKEAQFALKLLRGKKFEYPIFYDIEEDGHVKLPKSLCSDIVRTFCNILEKQNYWAGVYSFDSFFFNNLEENIPLRYTAWVARTSGEPRYCTNYALWQNSWKGSIPGSSAETDTNICYEDFETLIKQHGKNGFSVGSEKIYTVKAISEPLNKKDALNLSSRLNSMGMTSEIIIKE